MRTKHVRYHVFGVINMCKNNTIGNFHTFYMIFHEIFTRFKIMWKFHEQSYEISKSYKSVLFSMFLSHGKRDTEHVLFFSRIHIICLQQDFQWLCSLSLSLSLYFYFFEKKFWRKICCFVILCVVLFRRIRGVEGNVYFCLLSHVLTGSYLYLSF